MLVANSSPPTPGHGLVVITLPSPRMPSLRATVLPFTCTLVGPKIDSFIEKPKDVEEDVEVAGLRTTDSRAPGQQDRATLDEASEVEVDDDAELLDVYRGILQQQGQILTELEDDLIGLSEDSLTVTGATEGMGDLFLCSDEEHEVTVISAPNQNTELSTSILPVIPELEDKSAEDKVVSRELTRQNALTQVENASEEGSKKPKIERAKNGTKVSLAYLHKMAKKDLRLFSERERFLIRKHWRSVQKFERIFGPTSVHLGRAIPDRSLLFDDSMPENAQSMVVESSTGTVSDPSSSVGGIDKSAGSSLTKAGRSSATGTLAKKGGDVTTAGGSKPLVSSLKAVASPSRRKAGQSPSGTPNRSSKSIRNARPGDDQPSTSRKAGYAAPAGGSRSLTCSLKATAASPARKMVDPSPSVPPKGSQKEMVKRARSGDDQPSTSKKAKKSLSLEEGLMAAVIDRSDPDGRISTELWQAVEARLIDTIALARGRSGEVEFNGAEWSKGVKVINCGNRKTFDFLSQVVGDCGDLSTTASLAVIPASELPLRPIVTVWIPPPVRTVETILSALEVQNTELTTNQWQLMASLPCSENQGRDFRFAVDQGSLDVLDRMGCVARFGVGRVRFRFAKSDKPKGTAGGADQSAPL